MLNVLRRVFSFSSWTVNHPLEPPPGDMLDASFDAQNQKIAELEALIDDIRRSDGRIQNGIVSFDSLEPQLKNVLGLKGPPVPGQLVAGGSESGEAEAWAETSRLWAEHMPDTIPDDSLAEMDITGDHWSSRWWANRAAQLVSDTDLGTGVRPTSLYYIATASQTVFPTMTPDTFGKSAHFDVLDTVHVSRSGTRLMPNDGFTVVDDVVTLAWPAGVGEPVVIDIWSAANFTGVPRDRATVSPFQFGGIGDGVADDTAAINDAINFLAASFKGGTVDMSGGRWLVDSGDIVVKSGVSLVGSWLNVGEVLGGDYPSLTSSIHLNPLYTVHLAEDFSAIRGMVVMQKAIIPPTGVRQIQDMVNAFSGKAITVGSATGGSANDTYAGYCFLIGFQYGWWCDNQERPNVEYLRMDCTNGVYLKNCHDMNHLSHCHVMPLLAAHLNLGAYSWAISGAVNNGSGLIRLTLASNPLVTGDIITVTGVTGATQANGRWTVTVIDSTHVDLQSSAFSSAYVSGGTLYMHYSMRHGTAYNFAGAVDWGQADHCFSWGWDTGFNIEACAHVVLVNCGADQDTTSGDPTTIGFRVKDSINTKLIGCKTAAQAVGVLADNASDTKVMGVIGHNFWGNNASGSIGLKIVNGRVNMTNSDIAGLTTGVYVDPASDGVHAVGNRGNNTTTIISAPPGKGQRMSFVQANDWADASTIGNQLAFSNTQRGYKWDEYSDTSSSMVLVGRKARGSYTTPTTPALNDSAIQLRGDFWDGVDQFRTGGLFRISANGVPSATSVPTRMYWSLVNTGSTTLNDIMSLTPTAFGATTDMTINLGGNTNRWAGMYGQYLTIQDGMNTPGTLAGSATIFVDQADGDLKVKFSDGVVKTIVVDT